MHRQIRALQDVTSRRGSGRVLTFGMPHVLKALQLLSGQRFVSRARFSAELGLGEGSVKTLISRLRESGMIDTIRSGAFLTDRGGRLARELSRAMPSECRMGRSDMLQSGSNHAIVLRGYSGAIRSGIEQRDYAIMCGASSAVTLLYRDGAFVFPATEVPALSDDGRIRDELAGGLDLRDGDVVIIASSEDGLVSEISAKNAALRTVSSHGGH